MKTTSMILTIVSFMAFFLSACTVDNTKGEQPGEKPLNISVILDLSDRLIRNNAQPQMERDTAIIGYLCDMFSRKTIGPNILTSKNKMRVIFYPIPKIPNINALAKNLDVDVSAYKGIEKRKTIEAMHSNFVSSLLPIYNETQKSSKWLGCDIWDFFSSGRIKTQCMEEGARNIVIILSDGFLFHEKNKIREGNAYSYVLPQTLKNQKSSLIVRRNDLQDIEVLMLEINAKNTTERDKLKEVLRTWFCEMGVKHICIEETDLTIQTQRVIDEFFRE